jgi:hypothetical protein
MKGEKISSITTDMGAVVAVITFFSCAIYLLLDLRIVLLDGWSGIMLRATGIMIMIWMGYMPYWLMSIFYRRMRYTSFGFGVSVGFMVGDVFARISLPILGIFHSSGYAFLFFITASFFVIFFVSVLFDRVVDHFMHNSVCWRSSLSNMRKKEIIATIIKMQRFVNCIAQKNTHTYGCFFDQLKLFLFHKCNKQDGNQKESEK